MNICILEDKSKIVILKLYSEIGDYVICSITSWCGIFPIFVNSIKFWIHSIHLQMYLKEMNK